MSLRTDVRAGDREDRQPSGWQAQVTSRMLQQSKGHYRVLLLPFAGMLTLQDPLDAAAQSTGIVEAHSLNTLGAQDAEETAGAGSSSTAGTQRHSTQLGTLAYGKARPATRAVTFKSTRDLVRATQQAK